MNISEFHSRINRTKETKKKPVKIYSQYKTETIIYEFPFTFGQQVFYYPGSFNSEFFYKIANLFNIQPIRIEKSLFFDLETTGLSMGAGNYPFLIAFLYVRDYKIHIKQFFAESFSQINLILKDLANFVLQFDFLFSYNGKSFDINILLNQYILNHIQFNPFEKLVHFDFLHILRRIYKNIIPKFSLTEIEKELFGFYRINDVPGKEVSEIYLSYLKSRDYSRCLPILRHNKHDLLSLISIFLFLNDRFIEFTFGFNHLINIIDYLIKNKEYEYALNLMKKLDQKKLDRIEMKRLLATIFKKTGHIEKSVALWESIEDIDSYIELAKYYEHKDKNIPKALYYAKKAEAFLLIELEKNFFFIQENGRGLQEQLAAIQKRIFRLKGKNK